LLKKGKPEFMNKGVEIVENTLTFEHCTQNQLALLQQISVETYTDTFAQYNSIENMQAFLADAYATEQLLAELQNPNTAFFFLKQGQMIVGYFKVNTGAAQSEPIGDEAFELERIYVRNGYKGQGFGKQMIQKAERMARELKKKTIWLGVWEHNLPALVFYQRMEFVPFSSHTFYMGDDAQRDLLLWKKLVAEREG